MFKHVYMSGKIMAAAFFGVALLAFALWRSPLLHDVGWGSGHVQNTAEEQLDSKYTADSDNDGIRDWEETLLGFDPYNADSDGDGKTDAEELAETRALAQREVTTNATSTLTESQTEILLRQIFGSYIQAKQQGTFDPESFDFLVAETTAMQFVSHLEPQYSEEDILITQDTSLEQALTYELAFQDALQPLLQIEEYELTTYGRAIETQNEEDFETLRNAASIYKNIATNLLTLTVPNDGARAHLDIINSFNAFAEILITMADTQDDPIHAFVAARNFIEGEDAIHTAYTQLNIYFTLKEPTS